VVKGLRVDEPNLLLLPETNLENVFAKSNAATRGDHRRLHPNNFSSDKISAGSISQIREDRRAVP